MSACGASSGPSGTQRLLDVVARLRGKDGCPWDREQTLESLKPLLIEEAYELLDAVDSGDPRRHQDELGDVLLQVALQACIREEEGAFAFDDVAHHIADKLVRRHPHVFGNLQVADSARVLVNWEAIKAKEKENGFRSVLEGIPRRLPALLQAQRVQARAARVGFDWTALGDVLAKVGEELREMEAALAEDDEQRLREEIGDLLFAIVNLCRFRKIDAEEALADTIRKFIRRFQQVERRLHAEGRNPAECPLSEMDAQWDRVKREERQERATGHPGPRPAAHEA